MNCWERMGCGHGPESGVIGVCIVASERRMDGVNGGVNAGRCCWAVTGTLCGGEVQGHFAQKHQTCLACAHFLAVRAEQGESFTFGLEHLAVENLTRALDELAGRNSTPKLQTMGELMAGLVHEMASPLQYALSNMEFVADQLDTLDEALRAAALYSSAPIEDHRVRVVGAHQTADGEFRQELREALDESLEGLRQLVRLVITVQRFMRPSPREKALIDVAELIQDAVKISRNEWKYDAQIKLELEPTPPLAVYPDELRQAILNLVVNAAHSIHDHGASGGEIGISLQVEPDTVKISVSDNGPGVPPALRECIWQRFFTTREQGTGQGLSLVQQYVDLHEGTIALAEGDGSGARFVMRLPRMEALGSAVGAGRWP